MRQISNAKVRFANGVTSYCLVLLFNLIMENIFFYSFFQVQQVDRFHNLPTQCC